jgi:hypothetical protein
MNFIPGAIKDEIENRKPTPLFIPTFWDERISFFHRLFSVLAGVILPLGIMCMHEKSEKFFGLLFIFVLVITIPYRLVFFLLSTITFFLWNSSILDWVFYALGIAAIVAGRLTKSPFWVNAYITRLSVIALNFYYLMKIGSTGA